MQTIKKSLKNIWRIIRRRNKPQAYVSGLLCRPVSITETVIDGKQNMFEEFNQIPGIRDEMAAVFAGPEQGKWFRAYVLQLAGEPARSANFKMPLIWGMYFQARISSLRRINGPPPKWIFWVMVNISLACFVWMSLSLAIDIKGRHWTWIVSLFGMAWNCYNIHFISRLKPKIDKDYEDFDAEREL